ncbi:MAG: TrmH family RNA methyltransferase [Acidimicrobiales bacterium]
MSDHRSLGGTELKRLHRTWRRQTPGRLSLLLDGVQTPYNVGSILRTAAAYRIDHLWLAGPTARPGDAKTRKTALGSDKFLTWDVVDTGPQGAELAKAQGYLVVGVELAAGALPLHELDLATDVCLAVGHEDRGLAADTIAACDRLGFLPQLGRIGSLNVATAASLAIYEVRRQAWTAAPGTHEGAGPTESE